MKFFQQRMPCSRLWGRTLTKDEPEFPTKALTFPEIGAKEVSSAANVLVNGGDIWSAGICGEVEGLSSWTGVGVTVRKVSDILE
jgi:hypothetical protein